MRYWLFIGALLTCVVLIFLTSVSAESPLLSRHYTEIVLLGIALSIFLFLLVIYQLASLVRQRRQRVFGSRLMTRLVVLLASTAFLPGIILYTISVHFIAHSIDSWFDTHIETAIQSGVNLGKSVLSDMLHDLMYHGQQLAGLLKIARHDHQRQALLRDFIQRNRFTSAMLTDRVGHVTDFAIMPGALFTAGDPSSDELADAAAHHGYVHAEPLLDNGLGLRAIIPLQDMGAGAGFLVLNVRVSDAISRTLNEIQDINGDYMRLSLARQGLLWVYQVSLTLAILLALLIAINLAIYYSNRLSSPLIMLARGTEAVAQGDLSPREISGGRDELSILTRSFNTMIAQLSEARQAARQNSAQLAAEKEYLDNLLSQISTGVMTFDPGLVLRLVNDSAKSIVGSTCTEVEGVPLTQWHSLPKEFTQALLTGMTAEHRRPWRKEVAFDCGGQPKRLLLQGTYLETRGEGQWVLVFDDVTPIVHAQKMIAWGEVAQRLAHEIKNPLTPIQLCAERLQMKLGPHLVGADRFLLDKMIQMIVTQVTAMKELIDDFRSLSHLPEPTLMPCCLNQLLEEVLEPYTQTFFRIQKVGFDQKIMVVADMKQLRQVFLNLIVNAEQALEGHREAAVVIVRLYQDECYAYCSISDNGPGFSSDVMMKALEPYITTKKRGTGLGLAIVKKIVDDHNGMIKLENHAQGGACVTVGFSKST